MRSISLKTIAFVFSAIFLSVIYQNCSPTAFNKELASQSSEADSLSVSPEDVLQNKAITQPPACSEENSVEFIFRFIDGVDYLCIDNTSQSSTRTGEICSAGPKLKEFKTIGTKVSCDLLTVCGVEPKIEVLETANNSTTVKYSYNRLPLGCSGQIKISRLHNVESSKKIEAAEIENGKIKVKERELKVIDISLSTGSCNFCQHTRSFSCGPCEPPPPVVDPVKSCNLAGFGVIAHGQSIMAYLTGSVGFGELCKSESRVCTNGVLSGSYSNKSCSVDTPVSCKLAGFPDIAHNGSSSVFQTSSVVFGKTCVSENRKCSNGVLSGSFVNKSCVVDAPASCNVPGLGVIAHGQTIMAYLTGSVGFGALCKSESRVCTNGVLSGSYSNKSCSVDTPASCKLAGFPDIVHNGSASVFQTSSVAFGKTCVSENRKCSNGVLSGSFVNKACVVDAPASCNVPGLGVIAHEQSIVAYNSASASNGELCKSETRTCFNGALSGSLKVASCAQSYYKKTDLTFSQYAGASTRNLGVHLRCNVTSFSYDGDGTGNCILAGSANGAWSLKITDEGSKQAQICNVTCTDLSTAALGSPTEGATCSVGGAGGIAINSCCHTGTTYELLFTTTRAGKGGSMTRHTGTTNDIKCTPLK